MRAGRPSLLSGKGSPRRPSPRARDLALFSLSTGPREPSSATGPRGPLCFAAAGTRTRRWCSSPA
eukprot:4967263-Alexandrium_andersonii.AAC.1